MILQHVIKTWNNRTNCPPFVRIKLPPPKKHKLYFDCGDQTLDAFYPPIQRQVDQLMLQKGYSKNNWLTIYEPGADHSEKSWKSRLHIPMTFLLSNQNPK
jgi:hypothetical protein